MLKSIIYIFLPYFFYRNTSLEAFIELWIAVLLKNKIKAFYSYHISSSPFVMLCFLNVLIGPPSYDVYLLFDWPVRLWHRQGLQTRRVLTAIKTGVFDHQDKTLSPFTSVKNSLTLDAGCLLYGSRVVIPTRHQARLLFELHTIHMGVVKMKSSAREYIWWPGLNKEIESLATKCEGCARFKKKPAPVPLTHWSWATRPMERIYVDFAEYRGVQLLIVIDVYSKYIWTFIMGKDTTTPRLLHQMECIFAERGLPTTVVRDNGPQFTSKAFTEHMKARNIKHVLTPPYHTASNGCFSPHSITSRSRHNYNVPL